MKEGSVCIMDAGMWHKAGKSTSTSRWSIFSQYSGWFVKPYFNYQNFGHVFTFSHIEYGSSLDFKSLLISSIILF